MAQSPSPAPVTEDAFMADRQKFWNGFCSFTTGTVIALVLLLVAMLVFLVR